MKDILAFLGLLFLLAGISLLIIYLAFPDTWKTIINLGDDDDEKQEEVVVSIEQQGV